MVSVMVIYRQLTGSSQLCAVSSPPTLDLNERYGDLTVRRCQTPSRHCWVAFRCLPSHLRAVSADAKRSVALEMVLNISGNY